MRVRHLSKTYTPESGEVKALNDVNFELSESGMVFILGKSGSGKSTLLNLVSGLDRADKGSEIETCGIEIVSCSANERDVYRNSSCGFVFQEYNLIPELNVKENIKLSWQLQGNKDNDEIVEKTLQKVELGGYGDRKVTELSGGQKQRVAIARAIIKEPKIIFADEPTGALDEDTGESIFKLLKAIAKDRLVIVVTHDREFAEKYADRIIELANGKIISDSDEGYIATAQEKVEHKKSKLPIKAAAKIGCANFKFHPIRLVATIFLSVIAFTFLGICLSIATTNPRNNYINAVKNSGTEYAVVYKQVNDYKTVDQSLDRFFGIDNEQWVDTDINLNDGDKLHNAYGGDVYIIDGDNEHAFQQVFGKSIKELMELTADRPEAFSITASGVTYIDEDDCAKLGYTVTGRLPQNDMEIAVNENILNSFLVAGLYENGEKITFEIAKDFIGHKLPMPNVDDDGNKQYSGGEVLKTVVGVVNTGCSKKCRYNHINDPKHLHDKIYVHKGYKGKFHFALCKIDGGFDKLANYVFDTTFDENRFNLSEPNLGYYLVEKNLTLIKFLCLYASIIFCVTALILLTNFIGTSVRRQMKQIGILSAMGADLKCLLQIYGSSVGIICAVVYLLSVAFSAAFVAVVNSLIIKWTEAAFTVLWFSPLLIVVLLGAVLFCWSLGIIVPLLRIRKLSSVDAIGRGQIK